MTSTVLIGAEIAPPIPPRNARYSPPKLFSVQDLLDTLQVNPTPHVKMLLSTAERYSEFLERPCHQISLALLVEKREDFRQYLKQRKYARNSVRAYSQFVNMLVSKAGELGWQYCASPLPGAWIAVSSAAEKDKCMNILTSLTKQGCLPCDVGENDLYDWVQKRVERGLSFEVAQREANRFRVVLVDAGHSSNLDVEKIQKPRYGTQLKMIPEPLLLEIEEILTWKQANYAEGRPNKGQLRAVTARLLEHEFRKLFGFVTNIEGNAPPLTLRDLITEATLSRYIRWMMHVRRVQGGSLAAHMGLLYAALRYHPNYKDCDFSWFERLKSTLPQNKPEDVQSRKNEKYLDYGVLASIPAKIRTERSVAAKLGSKALAVQVRDELLMAWLLILPWRQRNIRECRIGRHNPNLFKDKLFVRSGLTKPQWMQDAEKLDPGATFWQFRFTGNETKMGDSIHSFLPLRLVALLEEYLNEHRKELIGDYDPGTLFLAEDGKALKQDQVSIKVAGLTLRYGGRISTPHLFRDAFAYMWLEKYPEDYLTVSKHLWHRSIQTTIKIYGARFNESTALCRIEERL